MDCPELFLEKNAILLKLKHFKQIKMSICSIVCWENRPFSRRKLAKIAENNYDNIDPLLPWHWCDAACGIAGILDPMTAEMPSLINSSEFWATVMAKRRAQFRYIGKIFNRDLHNSLLELKFRFIIQYLG
jgi:hypothetical protein